MLLQEVVEGGRRRATLTSGCGCDIEKLSIQSTATQNNNINSNTKWHTAKWAKLKAIEVPKQINGIIDGNTVSVISYIYLRNSACFGSRCNGVDGNNHASMLVMVITTTEMKLFPDKGVRTNRLYPNSGWRTYKSICVLQITGIIQYYIAGRSINEGNYDKGEQWGMVMSRDCFCEILFMNVRMHVHSVQSVSQWSPYFLERSHFNQMLVL